MPRSLFLISTAVALSLLGDQMLYTVLPVVHEAVGVPVTAVGLLLGANRLVRLVTNTFAGYVVTRWGRHWPFVLALFLGGVSTVAYGVLYGVGVFLVARLLWGTCRSFIRLEGLQTALDVASDTTRGRAMGTFQALSRLGSALAMLTGGLLTDIIGFRTTFVLFGILTGGAALLAHYEMTRRQRERNASQARDIVVPDATLQRSVEQPTTMPIDRRTHWRMAAANFGTFSAFLVIGGLVSATLGYMLRDRFGPTPTLGALTLGVASLTGLLQSLRGFLELVLAPGAGYLADRWGRHQIIATTMPLAIVAVAILALQPALPLVAVALPGTYVASVSLNVAFNAVAGDIAPPGQRSKFLSRFVTWQDLGAAAGPLLGYWIAPCFGLFWLYGCGASILLVATVFYFTTFRGYALHTSAAQQQVPV